MSLKDKLIRTKEVLIERGRAQVVLVNADGRCCLLGAVGLAEFGSEWEPSYSSLEDSSSAMETVAALADDLDDADEDGDLFKMVWRFNDDVEDAEVFGLIDRAIEKAS